MCSGILKYKVPILILSFILTFGLVSSGAIAEAPVTFSDVFPEDEATNVEIYPDGEVDLEINVTHDEEQEMTVTFVDASDDSVIGEVENHPSGEIASMTWENLDYDTTYDWNVDVEDEDENTTGSDVYSFTTEEEPEWTVTFDETNDLEGVEIDVDGQTITTDTNGEATIDLTDDTYSYTATKDGYEDHMDDVMVDGEDTIETFTMQEIEGPSIEINEINWVQRDHAEIDVSYDIGTLDEVQVEMHWFDTTGGGDWEGGEFETVYEDDPHATRVLPHDYDGEIMLDPYTHYEYYFAIEGEYDGETYRDETEVDDIWTMPEMIGWNFHHEDDVHYPPKTTYHSFEGTTNFHHGQDEAEWVVYWREEGETEWNEKQEPTIEHFDNNLQGFGFFDLESNTTYEMTIGVYDAKNLTDYEHYMDEWQDVQDQYKGYANFEEVHRHDTHYTWHTGWATNDIDEIEPYTFTTDLEPPTLDTLPAVDITDNTANLKADIPTLGDYDQLDLQFTYKEGDMRVDDFEMYYNESWEWGLSLWIGYYDGYIYYFGSGDFGAPTTDFVRYNVETGNHEVIKENMGRPQHGAVIDDGILWAAGFHDFDPSGFVFGYDLEEQEEVDYKIVEENWIPTLVAKDGVVYYQPHQHDLVAWDWEEDEILWEEPYDDAILPFTDFHEDEMFTFRTIMDEDNNMEEIYFQMRNATTGDLVWEENYTEFYNDGSLGIVIFEDGYGYVVFTPESGDVAKFDVDTGQIEWITEGVGSMLRSKLVLEDGNLVVGSHEHHDETPHSAYLLDTETGDVEHYFEPEIDLMAYFTGPDGLYFFDGDTAEVQTFDLTGLEKEEMEITEEGEVEMEITNLQPETTYEYFTSSQYGGRVFGGFNTFTTQAPEVDLPLGATALLALIPLIMMVGVLGYITAAPKKPKYAIYAGILALLVVAMVVVIAGIV